MYVCYLVQSSRIVRIFVATSEQANRWAEKWLARSEYDSCVVLCYSGGAIHTKTEIYKNRPICDISLSEDCRNFIRNLPT